MKKLSVFLGVWLLVAYLGEARTVPTSGMQTGPRHDTPHTVTWWCVDLNELWRLNVPVIAWEFTLVPPDPSPVPPCPTTSAFPITVPAGSPWSASGSQRWTTNKKYPPPIAEALTEMGYHFRSHSPMEDFLKKMVEVRFEVRTFPMDTPVATFTFDPRRIFRLVQQRRFLGEFPLEPGGDPSLGTDLSVEAIGRLPTVHFAGIGGGLPPGSYNVYVFWVIAEQHNDGLGLDGGNFLPAGDLFTGSARFEVVP